MFAEGVSSRVQRSKTTDQRSKIALPQVAVALSIIAATWCAKTVDNNAVPFYKNDLKNFYISRDNNGNLIKV